MSCQTEMIPHAERQEEKGSERGGETQSCRTESKERLTAPEAYFLTLPRQTKRRSPFPKMASPKISLKHLRSEATYPSADSGEQIVSLFLTVFTLGRNVLCTAPNT